VGGRIVNQGTARQFYTAGSNQLAKQAGHPSGFCAVTVATILPLASQPILLPAACCPLPAAYCLLPGSPHRLGLRQPL
jgi:hypothetical protein